MPYRVTAERLGDEPSPFGADPLDDESQIGFLARLAARQGGYTVHMLAVRLGMPVLTNRFYPEVTERLARFAGTSADKVRALSYGPVDSKVADFRGRAVPSRMLDGFSGIRRRLCPACLGESGHHRCWWDIQAISACPVHACTLVDTCPRCRGPLRWRGIGVITSSCRCEVDLTALAGKPIGEEDRAATAVTHGLLGDPRFSDDAERARRLPPMVDLDDGARVELLFRFGLDLLGPRPKALSVIVPPDRGHLVHRGLSDALAALERWPGNVTAALERIRAANSGRGTTRAGVILPLRRWLNRMPAGRGTVLREFVDTYR